MPRLPRAVFRSSSPDQTAALGRRLARALAPGAVVAILGPLGAGKTVFVKGLAAGLGLDPRAAVSPTYSLVNELPGALPLFHADLYRIRGEEEARELGLEEYAGRGGVLAVEWPERAGGLLPADAVRVEIEPTGERTRRVEIIGAALSAKRVRQLP